MIVTVERMRCFIPRYDLQSCIIRPFLDQYMHCEKVSKCGCAAIKPKNSKFYKQKVKEFHIPIFWHFLDI